MEDHRHCPVDGAFDASPDGAGKTTTARRGPARRGGFAAVVVALSMLSACSGGEAEADSPQDTPPATAAVAVADEEPAEENSAAADSADESPVADPVPVRPHDVDLTGVDPCALLTEEQRVELGATDPPKPLAEYADGYEAGCNFGVFLGDPTFSYDVGVAASIDFDRYLGSPNAETREVDVLGFPAVERRLLGTDSHCIIDIGTSDGQTLSVHYMDASFEEPPELVCEKAATATGLAIQTLMIIQG